MTSEPQTRSASTSEEAREKGRKPVGVNHVMVTFWFKDAREDERFRSAEFAPASTGKTVHHQAWQETVEPSEDGSLVRKFRYVHICRNKGNHRVDADRFVFGVLKRTGQGFSEVRVLDVQLVPPDPVVVG